MDIGRIDRVPLRDVWPHEARDFTTWLECNLDLLGDLLGLQFSEALREASAGDFSVDLVAEDDAGNTIVIENQFGRSNHDHLGKVLTYLAMREAHGAVWVVEEPRPEHVRAVSWLNDSSSGRFYLVKIEAVRIGDSLPAPLMTLIVGPSEASGAIARVKKEDEERDRALAGFWAGLVALASEAGHVAADTPLPRTNWLPVPSGTRGLIYYYVIRRDYPRIELAIDRGRTSPEIAGENRGILGQLREREAEIASAMAGLPVEWESGENRHVSKVCVRLRTGGHRSPAEEWPAIQAAMVGAMALLRSALDPHIRALGLRD